LPCRLSPFVLYDLLSVCFRGASTTSKAGFLLPSELYQGIGKAQFFQHLRSAKKSLRLPSEGVFEYAQVNLSCANYASMNASDSKSGLLK
jgi:hypothetical protein